MQAIYGELGDGWFGKATIYLMHAHVWRAVGIQVEGDWRGQQLEESNRLLVLS